MRKIVPRGLAVVAMLVITAFMAPAYALDARDLSALFILEPSLIDGEMGSGLLDFEKAVFASIDDQGPDNDEATALQEGPTRAHAKLLAITRSTRMPDNNGPTLIAATYGHGPPDQ